MYWNSAVTSPNPLTESRLTLTWDVLKLWAYLNLQNDTLRLTLTWDVLKWYTQLSIIRT